MSKKKIIQNGEINIKGGVFSGNRRWSVSRMSSVSKKAGNKKTRKPKK